MQGLVFGHSDLIAFGLGAAVGILHHIIIDGLAPDGSGSIPSVHSIHAGRMVPIDVLLRIKEHLIEILIGLPLYGVGICVLGTGGNHYAHQHADKNDFFHSVKYK